MRSPSYFSARLILDFFGAQLLRICLGGWWCWMFALALSFRVSDRCRVRWLAKSNLLWGRVEETCFDTGERFLGEEVDAVDDLV